MAAHEKPPVIKPPTLPLPEALKVLRLSRSSLERLMDRGVFTVVAPHGRGIGKRLFFRTDEIELYGSTRDEEAVRRLRAEREAESAEQKRKPARRTRD